MSDLSSAVCSSDLTAWTNVFERGRLQPGETLLVHGGSSGIGTTAIQLGRAFGARVLATAGSADKALVCEALGAERCIHYRNADFVEVVKAAGGAAVILDMVGGPSIQRYVAFLQPRGLQVWMPFLNEPVIEPPYIQRNVDCLKREGRLVQIAFLQKPVVERFNFLKVMTQRLTITGSTLRPRTVAQKAAIARQLEERVWPLLEARTVKPLIHSTFPLEDAAGAHALMESSRHIGKILLEA